MPQFEFLICDAHARLAQRRSVASKHGAGTVVAQKRRCFDFHRLADGTNPATAVNLAGLFGARVTADAVAAEIATAFGPPRLDGTFAYVVLPKADVGWRLLRTGTYTPDLAHSTRHMDFEKQCNAMKALIRGAIDLNCQIFAGPECVVYHGRGTNKLPFHHHEKERIEELIALETRGRDLALFIPGTIWWEDRDGGVHNSVLAFSNGASLNLGYDKRNWTGEEDLEAGGFGTPVHGAQSFARFNWNGLDVAVQICQDTGDAVGASPDLHFVLGWGTGGQFLKQRVGGIGVYVDAQGKGMVQDEFATKALAANDSGRITVTDAMLAAQPGP